MSTNLYLILPPEPLPDEAALVPRLVTAGGVAALLVRRGSMAENAYKARAKALVGPVQAENCAVLIEGAPGLVRLLGADGLHVEGDSEAVAAAIEVLKPDLIVGTGPLASRHEAMERGEMDVDYILFGPLSGAIAPEMRELARWWAETMEVPSVLNDPEANAESSAEGSEFLALSDSIFASSDPEATIRAIATALEARA